MAISFSSSADFPDDILHVTIVSLALFLVILAALVYLRKRNTRYLFLLIAFAFLFMSQTVTMLEVTLFSNAYLLIPYTGLHLSHLFDFLMILSFGLALVRSW
ncbi:MAG: hypothetical protein ACREBS_01745 [Nitrososphaerales archaeon]